MLNKLIHGPQGFAVGVRASAAVVAGLMGISCAIMQPRPRPRQPSERSVTEGAPQNAPDRPSGLTLLRDKAYTMNLLSGVLVKLGFFFPIFYLQLFAIKHGIDENLSFYTVSLINAGGVIGRLIPSFLADRLGSYNMLIPDIFAIAAFILGMLGATNPAGIIVISLLYGIGNGAYTSVAPALLTDLSKGVDEVG
ncbi:hypothetical protein HGRIS_010761 [Hohenbuehelia grisea]